MSTSIPSLSSTISGSFAGVSKFAASLQSVLGRAVGIAALPLQSLNNGLNSLNARQSALQSLETTFLSLQQSVTSLQSTLSTGLLNSSISDGSIVSAAVSSGALEGSYSIEVESLGSYSTAVSNGGATVIDDPATGSLSADTSLTLQVGASAVTITPESDSLTSLVDAINEQASDKVQATLVNVGTTSSPDYRLSLRAVKLGADLISLSDGAGSITASSTGGSLAAYKVNGLSASITSDSRTVTLAPGLTATLLKQSETGVATTVTVAHNTAAVASALGNFARSYNSAADAIAKHHGENSGALRGESLLLSLSGILTALGTYSNGSPATALTNFGLSLDKAGHLNLDNTEFGKAALADFSGLLDTLGNTETGGLLKSASGLLTTLEDPVTGLFGSEGDTLTSAITLQKKKIADQETRVTNLQNSLTAQLAKADAAIAGLESQVSYITGLFASFTSSKSSSNG